jgi:sulfatase modifying factor 1
MRISLCLLAIASVACAQSPVSFDLGNGQRLETIRIEPGTFEQGSPDTEPGRAPDESRRTVTLSQPFWLGKFPVTRGQFAAFVRSTNYRTEAERGTSGGFGWVGGKLVQQKQYTWRNPGFPQADDHPVVIVEYKDAQEFCRWLSKTTGQTFSLPTEAQWEYAARAGAATAPSGGWSIANSPTGTQPVGKTAANAWGFQDLLGNTWEWCEDWYAPYPAGPVSDPLQKNPNLSDKPRRVLRGGAFSRPATELRPAKRFRNDPGSRNADNGFRVVTLGVRSAPAAAPAAPAAVRPSTPPPANPPGILQPDPPRTDAEPLERPHSSAPPVERLADADAAPGRRTNFTLSKVLLFGIIGVFGFMIVRRFLRGPSVPPIRSNPGGPGTNPPSAPQPGAPLRVRTAADGFWVSGQIPRNTALRARWMAQGAQQERRFSYEPGDDGQFVFTGTQPISVSVSVIPDNQSGYDLTDDFTNRMAGPILPLPQQPPDRSSFQDDDRRRSRSYPSAY